MSSGWLARVGADPQARAREIGLAHSTFLSSGSLARATTGVREVVAQSWRRSASAQVDPDTDPPVTLTGADLAGYRAEHPLAAVLEVLRELMDSTAEDGKHLWAVSDTSGRLLWVMGDRRARARAERMNFVEGALWDEAHAGTNAPGTALALDHEVQIFATEHFRHTVQSWTCAAAPIHDPVTGQVLGTIDVTGGAVVAHPHSLALVRAAARIAEARLAEAGLTRAQPGGTQLDGVPLDRTPLPGPEPGGSGLWLPGQPEPPGRPARTPGAARLEALGRPEALLRLDGGTLRLNRRHSEIVLLLAAHPRGLTGDQLATGLYLDLASQTTLRVELTRLRRVAGDLLQSRPYRLTRPVFADYLDVRDALRRGDLATALAAYAGPLLPSSEAPGVVEQREWLDTQLRSAVAASGDPQLLQTWTERFGFDDLELWERLAAAAPAGSPRRGAAAARVRQLRIEYGLSPAPPLPTPHWPAPGRPSRHATLRQRAGH